MTLTHIEDYSAELAKLFDFIENVMEEEIPTPTISLDYFFLSILAQQQSFAYDRLESCISSSVLGILKDTYTKYMSGKALSAIKPGREINPDKSLTEAINGGWEIKEEFMADKLCSDHILLYILSDKSGDNRIKGNLNSAGVSYSMIEDKIKNESLDAVFTKFDPSFDPSWQFDNTTEENMNNQQKMKVLFFADGKEIDPMQILNEGIPLGLQIKQGTKSNTQNIDKFCVNLNDLAERGELDPLIGRENEIQEIIHTLGRRKKNNVILVGGEGVGKTAIGESLAYKIVNDDVPEFLYDKKLISLNMTALIGGTTLRGMFEERVEGLLNEIKQDKNYILFIDNIGSVFGEKSHNDYDISAMLSQALDNGDLQVIGTSDFKSFRSTFDKDPSLARKFHKIVVNEPSTKDSIEILNGLKSRYENFHHVNYTNDAIISCVTLAERYIPERNLPDAAIDLMDEAGSLVGTSAQYNKEIKDLRKEVKGIQATLASLTNSNNAAEIEQAKATLKDINKQIEKIKKEQDDTNTEKYDTVDSSVVLTVLSNKTGIPVTKLTNDDKKRLASIDERLKTEIIGQDEAIETICRALKRNRVGLSSNKCLASFLEIGKSGTGKTLLAKKLAKEIFGSEDALIRFDMSEYPDRTAVNKLIGSNPGYVGYEEGGQLTEAIKNRKHCVLLLDEIEKADPEIYNIFLQVLDEGFLTDNSGMKVDFKNVIVVFTSNIGTKAASDFSKGVGFGTNDNTKKILIKELKNKFPPEFINRLNSVIYFNSLTDDNLKDIIKLEIKKTEQRLKSIGYDLVYDDSVIEYLLSIVKDEKDFGARPVIRAIQNELEDKITDLLLMNSYNNGYAFSASCENNSVMIK